MTTQAQVDAIQTDVPAEDAPESVVALRSAREIAMEQIELANLERMGITPEPAEPAPAPVEPVPAPVVNEPVVTKVPVKVDGVQQEVDLDTLVRSYQKNSAADRRLEEAAQLLRQANERANQLEAQVQKPTPVAEPAPSADLRTEVKETLSVIYGGDEEAATEALTNLLAKNRGGDQPTPQAQPVSVDQLADAVSEKLEFDTAFAKVKSDYPDLIADPNLEMLTAMRLQQAVDAGQSRGAALLAVAGDIYGSLGKQPAGRPTPAPTPRTNSRQENKERLELVKPASSSAVLPAADAEEGDPSSVIAEMAARRLGQSLPRRTG